MASRDYLRVESPIVLVTIFLSAFLLFLIQPVAAKELLPQFGGTSSTWGATVVFFQFELLAGYLWAHFIIRFCSSGWRILLQSVLIFYVCILIYFYPRAEVSLLNWQSLSALDVACNLGKNWGMATFLLCSTSSLIQGLIGNKIEKSSVHRLYALSNIGSLVGLLLFPFFLESRFDLEAIRSIWTTIYFLYAFLYLIVLAIAYFSQQTEKGIDKDDSTEIAWSWSLLPALSSMLLLSVTAYCTHDVAAVPLFWVIPLALYLISWILSFSDLYIYRRAPLLFLLVGCSSLIFLWNSAGFIWLWLIHSSILFLGSTICHSELALRKPKNNKLTAFYLMTAFGSCCGAIFISFLAPYLFTSNIDYRLSLFYLVVLILLLKLSEDKLITLRGLKVATVICILLSIPGAQFLEKELTPKLLLERKRNFYGVVEVVQDTLKDQTFRFMNSGNTIHGSESLSPTRQGRPVAYYSPSSPVGRILQTQQLNIERKIGVIGLGVGSLSFYVRSTDQIVFFEINPNVVQLAQRWFSFLSSSNSPPKIKLGDARITLTNLPTQHFDILVIDAFSGDSIPMHLMTLEAMKLFLGHLNSEGILIYHISNRFLSLGPVLSAEAAALGLQSFQAVSLMSDKEGLILPSQYYVIANETVLKQAKLQMENSEIIITPGEEFPLTRVWTDSFSNIFSALMGVSKNEER